MFRQILEGAIKEPKKKYTFTLSKLRDLILVLSLLLFFFILAIVASKLLYAQWKIDMSNFNFTDFLSLIMAIFAVSLSAAFYFKATETSNNFYDNVYKFNQDVHKILGRIESGFGERLKHMDESYVGMSNKLDKLSVRRSEAVEKVKEEEDDIQAKLKEKDDLVDTLLEKVDLTEAQKAEFKKQLSLKEEELMGARETLNEYKKVLNSLEKEVKFSRLSGRQKYIIDYLSNFTLSSNLTDSELTDWFQRNINDFNEKAIQSMIAEGILNKNRELTSRGYNILVKYFREKSV